jgi:hypothetical protein
MRATLILSLGEIPNLAFDIELKGMTLPAASTDAVLIKSLRVELMVIDLLRLAR